MLTLFRTHIIYSFRPVFPAIFDTFTTAIKVVVIIVIIIIYRPVSHAVSIIRIPIPTVDGVAAATTTT
jgi:hypothetical protein